MAKIRELNWREATAAPVVFISGPEEFLAGRATRQIRQQLREIDDALEIHEIDAASYQAGQLINLTSPSLFAEPRLVIIRGLEKCTDELIIDGSAYVENPTEDTCVIFRHNSSSVRGKKLIESIRASHLAVEIACLEIKKDQDRVAFVTGEFESAGRKIQMAAVRALLDAFADDLAELAAACSQLLQDSAEVIDEKIVERYYGGRVETNSFKVADAALAGDTGSALSLLRHALATGADPVPLVAAMSMKIRQLAKLIGNRAASPQSLGMAPWQVDRARRDLIGWTEDGLANAIRSLAQADAAAKGAERDPVFALENLVRLIASKGQPHD